jgi:hypothetical protein
MFEAIMDSCRSYASVAGNSTNPVIFGPLAMSIMILGHRSIKSTETYIHLEQMIYQGKANDQFTVKVANTLEDAIKLMEVGFELQAEIEGHKLFRKRK